MKIQGTFRIGNRVIGNSVTNVGINTMLDTMFGATSKTSWYIGLIDADTFSGTDISDTMDSHAGWEEITSYSESTRQEWIVDSATSKLIKTLTIAEFTLNADANIKGLFISSDDTKDGTTGILWNTALYDDTLVQLSGDVIPVFYEFEINLNE